MTANAHAADKKFKIFLSMSYIGNDWQAEAANMVKAMAAHKDFADKVDLQVQVAGPNAQRQIQQINAMVQAGAQAIVVYPISPTALNAAVKNACDKGVMIIAYDAEITEPCAYNVTIDQEEAGRVTAEWLVKKLNGKGNIVVITGVPGTSVDTLRTKAAKEVFAKYPGIKIVAEAVGMWSQAVARTELSKILATHNWDQIDGLWMQVGCYTANTDADRGRQEARPTEALRRRRLQRRPHPDAAGRHRGRRRQRHLCADGRAAHLLRLAALSGGLALKLAVEKLEGKDDPQADDPAAADRDQRHDQVVQGRHLGGNEGRLQRLPAVDRAESGLVRLDLFAGDAGDRPAGRAGRPAGDLIGSARRFAGRRSPSIAGVKAESMSNSTSKDGAGLRAISVERVRKAYGATVAVDDVTFSIAARRGACPARRERRRQVDDREAAFRSDAARPRRLSPLRRRGHVSPRPRLAQAAGHPDGVPGNDAGRDLTVLDNMLLPYGPLRSRSA